MQALPFQLGPAAKIPRHWSEDLHGAPVSFSIRDKRASRLVCQPPEVCAPLSLPSVFCASPISWNVSCARGWTAAFCAVTRHAREAREARTAKLQVKAAHSKRRRGRKHGEHAAKVAAALAAVPPPGGVAALEQFELLAAGPVWPLWPPAVLVAGDSSMTDSPQFAREWLQATWDIRSGVQKLTY